MVETVCPGETCSLLSCGLSASQDQDQRHDNPRAGPLYKPVSHPNHQPDFLGFHTGSGA